MKQSSFDIYLGKLEKVLSYMEKNLEEETTLSDLADIAHISPYHFHRIYRLILGETPHQTLSRLRVLYALSLLKNTETSITNIAIEAGFGNSQNFAKVIKQLFNETARDMRKNPDTIKKYIESISSSGTGDDGHKMAAKIKLDVVSLAPFKAITLYKEGDYTDLFTAYEGLFETAEKAGLMLGFMGIYGIPYDDPKTVLTHECRFLCCLRHDGSQSLSQVNSETIAGGTYACFTHIGSYASLHDSIDDYYRDFLSQSNLTLSDRPIVCHYENDPSETPMPEWITNVYIPVEVIS